MTGSIYPYKGNEPYIFVSYAHSDKEQVFQIIEFMESAKYRVWYDEGIDPGTEWDNNIAEHIEGSSYFIAFLSNNYLESENCKDELNYARTLQIERVLVYLEDVVLPGGMAMRLNRIQAIYFNKYDYKDDFYKKLSQAEGIDQCRDKDSSINAALLNQKGESASDPQEAYEYFTQAAEQGNAVAQLNLGLWYMTGRYYQPDDESAFYWYEKAARNGNAEAQYHLGTYYEQGIVVDQDYKKAEKWYSEAANNGNNDAKKRMDCLCNKKLI